MRTYTPANAIELRSWFSFFFVILANCASLVVQAAERSQPLCTIAFDKTAEVIKVPVTVNGATHKFILDTGATGHVIDLSLRENFGPAIKTVDVRSDGERKLAESFALTNAMVDVIPLTGNAACVDLSIIRQAIDEEIRGVIGLPFFQNRVIQLNFDIGNLIVFDREVPRLDWGEKYRAGLDWRGHLRVNDILVGQAVESFIVDTGFTGTISLLPFSFDRLKKSNQLSSFRKSKSATVFRLADRESARLNEVSWGKYIHHDLVVDAKGHSSIGVGYLRRFVVTLDVTGEQLFVRPSNQFDAPVLVDASGLHLLRKNEESLFVGFVDEGSPSALAGIREGDVISQFNNQPVTKLRLSEVRHSLKVPSNQPITLTVIRDGAEKVISFTLPPS